MRDASHSYVGRNKYHIYSTSSIRYNKIYFKGQNR